MIGSGSQNQLSKGSNPINDSTNILNISWFNFLLVIYIS